MNVAITKGALVAFAAMLTLTACQMGGPRVGGPIVTRQTGVEGNWLGTDGVAISSFRGGIFETVARDTGNKLAEGTYRFRDQRTIEIELTSLIRQTTSTVNCAMVAADQLNCTSSAGRQFVLNRIPDVASG